MTVHWHGRAASAVAIIFGVSAMLIGTGIAGLLEDRQGTMKQVSLAFRPLGNMAKQHKFNAAAVVSGSQAIIAGLTKFKDLFPAGSEHADNSASPAVWTDRNGFDNALSNAMVAANRLAGAQDPLSLKAAADGMDAACSACHHRYRIDK